MNAKTLIMVLLLVLVASLGFSSDAYPVFKSEVMNTDGYLIPEWDQVPFKDIRPNKEFVEYLNNKFGLRWNPEPKSADKCLSYSASTVADYYSILSGMPLKEYKNLVSNKTEIGINPRTLENQYFKHHPFESNYDYGLLLIPFIGDDPTTKEKMPYDIKGYGDILNKDFMSVVNYPDRILGDYYEITLTHNQLYDFTDYEVNSIYGGHYRSKSPSFNQIKENIDKFGIGYAQFETTFGTLYNIKKELIYNEFGLLSVPVHAATLIGYGKFDCNRDGFIEDIFWVHDTYSTEWDGDIGNQNVKYKCIQAKDISEVIFPHKKDWPTFHSDYRRTGLSLLKGDLTSKSTQKDVTFEGKQGIDYLTSPAIGSFSGENKIITGTSSKLGSQGRVVKYKNKFLNTFGDEREEKDFITEGGVPSTPDIVDLDGDGKKEIVFADYKGYVYVLNEDLEQVADPFHVKSTDEDMYANIFSLAVSDLDFDGRKEIIFTDYYIDKNEQENLYIIELKDGKLVEKLKVEIGNKEDSTGSQYAISIANLDNDPNPEIVFTSNMFTYVYEHDGTKKWEYPTAMAWGSPVIADIDRDNIYDIVVNTFKNSYSNNFLCNKVANCKDQTLVFRLNKDGTIKKTYEINHSGSPHLTNTIGSLDDDKAMELVVAVNNGEKSTINIYDGDTLDLEGSYDDDTQLKRVSGSPIIVDIDPESDGKEIVFVTAEFDNYREGDLYGDRSEVIALSTEDLSSIKEQWSLPISKGMYGSPAVGDLDNDKTAEMVTTQLPSSTSTSASTFVTMDDETITIPRNGLRFLDVTDKKIKESVEVQTYSTDASITEVYGGINKQPILTVPEEIIVIAGELININASAYDPNNDSFEIYYSAPFNNSGFWQTNESHYGDYEILVTASDGNLSSSEYVKVKVLRHDAIKITNANVQLVNNSRIMLSRVYIEGINSQSNETEYQNNATITEANIIDSSIDNLTDNNWDTYYSAGSLTGAIVEQNNLNIPKNTKHIIVHLKLKITEEGNARFALYDYNNDYYDIVTSNLPVGENDYYFEIYDDEESYFTQDDDHYTLKVDNISNYINDSKIRWYYRYLNGDFYDQRVYDSEVKFVTGVSKPSNVTLNLNGKEINYEGTLDDNTFTLDKFSDGKTSDSLTVNGNKITKYIKVPRGVEVTNAVIRIGNKSVTSINATKIMTVSESQSKVSKLSIASPKEYIPDFIIKSPDGNIETLKVNISEDITVQDYCRDWSVNPSGNWNSYIDYIKFGPHCADQRDWHKTDIDDDGYPEYYMTTGETYSVWGKCRAEGTFNRKVDDFETSSGSSYGCVDGNCNEETEETKINLVQNSKKEKLSYPSLFCNVDGWTWGWHSGTSYKYWDSNSNGEWDSGEHREYYMVLECGQDSDCADNKFCNKAGLSDPLDFSCETPSCSQVTCQSWEITNISNHECGCDLAPSRCDTSKYGWRNVDDDEYCDSNNYPTSESRCDDWENSTIVNHIETCTLKEDRCYNTDSQINEEYYCDSYNYIRPLGARLNVGNYFVGNVYQDKIKDFDITSYMNKFLETCTDDYCMIPIEFDSYYETKFNISEVKVSYEVKYIENTEDVQNFVKSCDNCNYNIYITSNGDVNVKSIIYYGQNTAPIINNSKITVDLKEDSEIIINVLDNEDDVLLITSNHSGLYQLGNKLIWNPTYLDTGINYIEVIANDSIYVTKEIVEVEVISPKIAIDSFTKIYDDNGHSIYEAVIGNYDTIQRTINWIFDSGDGNSIYSNQNVILEPKEESVILIEHYYNSYGNNSVMFRVNSLSDSFTSYTNQYKSNPIEVKNFNILNKDVNKVLFEFTIDANNSIYDIKNLTWSLDTGIDVINNDMGYNLTKGEGMDVIVEYIYPYSGNFNPKAIVNIGSLEFESEINLSFKSPLKISSVNTLFENMNKKVIEVNILNNASWNMNLNDVSLKLGNITFGNISMYPGEESTFISEMVFDTFGVQYLNIETNSGYFGDSMSYEVNVENPIGINTTLLAPNVLEAEIISNWGIELQDINWTLGNISSNYQVSFNDSYFVIVETEDNITGELRVYNDQYENTISIFN